MFSENPYPLTPGPAFSDPQQRCPTLARYCYHILTWNPCLLKIGQFDIIFFSVRSVGKHAVRTDGEGNAYIMSILHHLEMRADQAVNKVPNFL